MVTNVQAKEKAKVIAVKIKNKTCKTKNTFFITKGENFYGKT